MLTLAALLLSSAYLCAQISFSPTIVFIDDQKGGVGNFYITNRAETAQEVHISFRFGYPDSDDSGNLVMNYHDSVAYAQYALDPMIRAFPRSFVVEPGQQRTVRLQVVPGAQLSAGMYFTRMVVRSTAFREEDASVDENRLGANIGISFDQITGVFYKRGQTSTGLVIHQAEAIHRKDGIDVITRLSRKGNAPYIGSVRISLLNDSGNVVAENRTSTTAYFDVTRKYTLPVKDLPPGHYTVNITFETQRRDVATSDLTQYHPVSVELPLYLEQPVPLE